MDSLETKDIVANIIIYDSYSGGMALVGRDNFERSLALIVFIGIVIAFLLGLGAETPGLLPIVIP